MPINISTVPKKRVTKSKKQEDAARDYKNNRSGPDPNAPQPPSPDSDVTDNDGLNLVVIQQQPHQQPQHSPSKRKNLKKRRMNMIGWK